MIADQVVRSLSLKGPIRHYRGLAFFKDSPDCLIIPWNAITPISISSRFAGALYNHSDPAVHESSDSEKWTRETFSKLVTFHTDTFLVSYFAFTRPFVSLPFALLITFSSFLLRSSPYFLFQSLLQRRKILKSGFRIYIGLAAPAALYRVTDFSIIMSCLMYDTRADTRIAIYIS